MSRFGGFAIASATLVAVAAVVGCGGGGGGTTMGGPPTPPPTLPPTIPPSPFICPSGGCTSFTLSGTSTRTIKRAFPTPVATQVVVSSVAQSINLVSGRVFHGRPATNYQTVETDTAPTQTLTTNTDNYVQVPVTTGNIVDIGYHSTDSNGVVMDVQYPDGNIIGQVPLGAGGWNNDASSIISETDPDGTIISETINADGSYSLTANAVAGTTTATQNPDGTGSANIPTVFISGTATQLTIPAQSGGIINYTISAVGAATPTPAPQVIPVPAWYAVAPTLASDSTTNLGVRPIPNGCVAPAFGSSGADLRRTQMRLDVIFGLLENDSTDTWVTSVGPVCQRITDTLNVFYDFTGQGGAAVLGGPTPIQTNTMSELIGLTAAVKSASIMRAASSAASAGSFQPQLVLARIRLEHWRLAILKQQLAHLRTFLEREAIR